MRRGRRYYRGRWCGPEGCARFFRTRAGREGRVDLASPRRILDAVACTVLVLVPSKRARTAGLNFSSDCSAATNTSYTVRAIVPSAGTSHPLLSRTQRRGTSSCPLPPAFVRPYVAVRDRQRAGRRASQGNRLPNRRAWETYPGLKRVYNSSEFPTGRHAVNLNAPAFAFLRFLPTAVSR